MASAVLAASVDRAWWPPVAAQAAIDNASRPASGRLLRGGRQERASEVALGA